MPENTKDRKPKTENRFIRLSFAFLILFVYFFGLTIPLLGPDEPRYAQVAREMFERGDWITPTLGGYDWFEKPALLYWLQIAAYHLFGVTEFAARFGSALFGLGTILSLWILGRHWEVSGQRSVISSQQSAVSNQQLSVSGRRESQKPKAESHTPETKSRNSKTAFADWLALIAASSIGLIVFSRGASFDIILTFPVTASLVGFFVFDQSKTKSLTVNRLPLAAFYFFIGVALIAKGLVGIVFPFAIVAFYHVLSRKMPNKTFVFSLFWGTILSFAVASMWYLPMYQTNGWKFIDEFFVQHHFQRYTSNKYQHPQPFWFFWLVLPLMTIPWLPFFLASIWKLFRDRSPKSEVRSPMLRVQSSKSEVKNPEYEVQSHKNHSFLPFSLSPLLLFSLSWLLVPLVFFSLSGSKLPGYVLPALPGALVLTARCVADYARKSEKRETSVKLVAFAAFAVVAVILQFFVMSYARHDTVKYLIAAADAKGLRNEKIVNLYTVSHNLEFYAAGRLVRETDGKLKRYDDFSALAKDLESKENGQVLVLVPPKDVPNLLKENNLAETEPLAENNESALVLVKRVRP